MRPAVGWPIAIVLSLLTVGAYVNGEAVNEWVKDHAITIDSPEEGPLVGVNQNERWLVVLIDFPDEQEVENCDQQRASDFLDSAALDYLNQGIAPNSTLIIDYHDRIVTTDYAMADYGHDINGEKDVGRNGVNPHTLAHEIVLEIENEVEWGHYDLDGDGWVDRFLILHCVKPQEDGGGSNSRIWSHFSSIEEIVDLPDDLQISHYTISSQYSSNNFGTVMHEMYHQLGAADLYPVHDGTVNQVWKGVGKWDIMASGNWNGNGVWPALPTSPSIELVGGERHEEIELKWLPGTSCSGPTYSFTGMSEGGTSLKIPIGTEEYIWMEYRSDYGYDSRLPGNGLLVLQQDLGSGDLADNMVNAHPERAWLKVIEADGEQNMVAGDSEGEASDLFSDGDSFGSEGILIRNRDGILVDWVANITVEDGTPNVEFSSIYCGHNTDVDLPNYGSVLTQGDSIPIEADCPGIDYDLESSDGRNIIVEDDQIIFSTPGVIGVIGQITGTISCDTGTPIDVLHDFEIFGNVPIESSYSATIPVTDSSIIEIPIELYGNGSQVWLVGVDGALTRIAETENNQKLAEGSVITLDISPAGLLSNGMIIKGELILASDSGHRYVIEIELVARDSEESMFEEWTSPAKLIPIALALSTLWVILGIRSTSGQVAPDEQEIPIIPPEGDDPTFVDPFS
jgi:M6 family metalloprotease-like protein